MALRFPRSVWAAILLAFVVVGSLRNAVAIPAFARKYGLPCSACHEAWPKLNSFGQTFKDNGYQLMNDRDEPIWQNPSYWPIAMRVTPHWHYESAGHQTVDNPADPTGLPIDKTINTSGFDLTGIDILPVGRWLRIFLSCWFPRSSQTAARWASNQPTFDSTTYTARPG